MLIHKNIFLINTPKKKTSLVWIKTLQISSFYGLFSIGPPKWAYKMSVSQNTIYNGNCMSFKALIVSNGFLLKPNAKIMESKSLGMRFLGPSLGTSSNIHLEMGFSSNLFNN